MTISSIIDSAFLFSTPVEIHASLKVHINFLNPDVTDKDKILRDALTTRLELELNHAIAREISFIVDDQWSIRQASAGEII